MNTQTKNQEEEICFKIIQEENDEEEEEICFKCNADNADDNVYLCTGCNKYICNPL